jgi:uncharacterized protein YprB with RNaseH-like and TPR domain
MITHTFCHLHKIGLKREQSLWEKGICDWESFRQFLLSEKPKRFPESKILEEEIEISMINRRSGNLNFFADRLPSHQAWRIFGDFQGDAVYLDIETNGSPDPTITAISLYDGKDIRCYAYGQNLEDFLDDICRYKLIVTYNGKCFDIPVIESFFHVKLDQAHIDLRYVLKRLGYSGGLKRCEKQAGISRGDLDGVDGYFAVLLWNDYYYHGNIKALETLLAYNIADVVNLEKLMILAYNLNVEQIRSFKVKSLPDPFSPLIPFQPDLMTIEKIKRRY